MFVQNSNKSWELHNEDELYIFAFFLNDHQYNNIFPSYKPAHLLIREE